MPKPIDIGETPEERRARKSKINRTSANEEPDVWGRHYCYTRQEAHDMMFDRLPEVRDFTVPREIVERMDLTPQAKLAYGVIATFPNGKRWRLVELAGLMGVPPTTTTQALQLLEDKKLLVRERFRSSHEILPAKYTILGFPSRFDNPQPPKFLSNDISNIEEELKERFHGLEFEQETGGFQKSHY